MIFVTTRYVRIGLEQAIYDRARQAAEGDRRSLANWIAVTVERALATAERQPRSLDGEGAAEHGR
jgi:hypothetical protein